MATCRGTATIGQTNILLNHHLLLLRHSEYDQSPKYCKEQWDVKEIGLMSECVIQEPNKKMNHLTQITQTVNNTEKNQQKLKSVLLYFLEPNTCQCY